MSTEDYIKAWPRGLIKYHFSAPNRLPCQSVHFLRDVGLPIGREPEWCFDGNLQQTEDELYAFGRHFTRQLVLDNSGTVFEYDAGHMVFLNSGIQEMAYCLTLRKRASRGRIQVQTEDSFQQFRKMFLEIDSNALADGSYWAGYMEEVREEMREAQ